MLIPLFSLENYSNIMSSSYDDLDTQDWVPLDDIIDVLHYSFVKRYGDLDARHISSLPAHSDLQEPVMLGGNTYTRAQLLISLKLLIPTHYACDYFFWNQHAGKEHVGIDIMLPSGTPILGLVNGTVVRVKHRDGSAKNEGNCVVVKTIDNYFCCYEHLEFIDVSMGEIVTPDTRIGRCGSTGNSTQYHLHLQVDKASAPFHPMRHDTYEKMKQHTIDPFAYLRKYQDHMPFTDLPLDSQEQEALIRLYKKGIIKGFEQKAFPEKTLLRYEMALLLDRVLQQENKYTSLPIAHPTYTDYEDRPLDDTELLPALQRLQKYGIMKGNGSHIFPYENLKGEELLALLGRIFYKTQDSVGSAWRQSYVDVFVRELIISSSWGYIRKAIPRKEVCVLLWKMLKN